MENDVWMSELGWFAAPVGVFLLWADVLLPIPSNLIMIAHGACFGFLYGAFLSMVGGVGATWIAWFIGRNYKDILVKRISPKERQRADQYLMRWGILAILLTRPIPILSESVALLSGTLSLKGHKVALYAFMGHIVPCVIYAYLGSLSLIS